MSNIVLYERFSRKRGSLSAGDWEVIKADMSHRYHRAKRGAKMLGDIVYLSGVMRKTRLKSNGKVVSYSVYYRKT